MEHKTRGVLCDIRTEAQEIIEYWVCNTIQNNQVGAFQYIKFFVWSQNKDVTDNRDNEAACDHHGSPFKNISLLITTYINIVICLLHSNSEISNSAE